MFIVIRAIWLPLSIVLLSLLAGYYISIVFLAITAFFAADCIGRIMDYFYLKGIYNRNPSHAKTFWNLFSATRCSREVMITVDKESKEYYRLLGYKWFHFLPDRRVSMLAVVKPRHRFKK